MYAALLGLSGHNPIGVCQAGSLQQRSVLEVKFTDEASMAQKLAQHVDALHGCQLQSTWGLSSMICALPAMTLLHSALLCILACCLNH